jgi:hypothetical protein
MDAPEPLPVAAGTLRWPTAPCSCTGCWNCPGRVAGCTCDTEWDEDDQ